MNKITGNEPAMPMCNELGNIYSHGLTIRQYYAGLAMQGYIAAGSNGMPDADKLAILAVEAADCLINELNKSE